MASKNALEWLLEEDQPAVRYLALTTLQGKPETAPEVRAANAQIPKKGWAADILAKQDPAGWWARGENLYTPKYLSTNWMLLILADLGLTRADPRIDKACTLWIRKFSMEDGGFSMSGTKRGHLCTTGNMARALVRFGYADHPKVRSAFEWLEKTRDKNGGWSCFGSGRNLDSWEGMSAFAVYPREKWTAGMTRAVADAAEFYLQRELHKQGGPYRPWERFHYPVHYYYDLLVGLDFLTALGYTDDPRLDTALSLLKKKRRPDGRWNLDAVHPDLEGKMAEWYAKYPKHALTPFALERAGEPSKMITLTAMRVLARLP
ncbi:MAG: terpene cyclase/mutase family protein [Methanobacteriota archaeon]|nr:MAG: terpene cyclase/mutase family protein [Euryarchaeota archaeon]